MITQSIHKPEPKWPATDDQLKMRCNMWLERHFTFLLLWQDSDVGLATFRLPTIMVSCQHQPSWILFACGLGSGVRAILFVKARLLLEPEISCFANSHPISSKKMIWGYFIGISYTFSRLLSSRETPLNVATRPNNLVEGHDPLIRIIDCMNNAWAGHLGSGLWIDCGNHH